MTSCNRPTMPDKLTEHEAPNAKVRIPRRVRWEIRDLVHPVTLRRRTMWAGVIAVGVIVVVGLAAWLIFFAPPTGERLVAQTVQAAGGMDGWNAIDEGTFTWERTIYDEAGAVERTETESFYFQKADEWKLVVETLTGDDQIVIGRDADGYWATENGEAANPIHMARGLGMMCESDACTPLCGAEMAFFRFSLPFKLSDPGVHPAYAGSTELNGLPADILDVTYDPDVGSDRWRFFIDRETKRIRKVEHYASADGTTPPEELYWADYKLVDGIQFGHRRTFYRSNGTKLEEYVITKADFDQPISSEIFLRPEKRSVRTATLN